MLYLIIFLCSKKWVYVLPMWKVIEVLNMNRRSRTRWKRAIREYEKCCYDFFMKLETNSSRSGEMVTIHFRGRRTVVVVLYVCCADLGYSTNTKSTISLAGHEKGGPGWRMKTSWCWPVWCQDVWLRVIRSLHIQLRTSPGSYDRTQTSFLENKLLLTIALSNFACSMPFELLCTLMSLNIKCLLRCNNYNF